MSNKVVRALLFIIVLFFVLTRFYKIDEIPPSVYWDEASIGYNAFSLAQTGKDEWGEFLPLHFRAFGEFKLPVYIYSAVPFVKIFGLNEFSVRVPAVLFSLGVVVLTFFLARKLTGNNYVGLWASFFISISPWFFIFSRTAYEATAGLFFFILGTHFFLLGKDKNEYFLIFSSLSFILSLYSYNSFRVVIPLTLLVLIIFYSKDLIVSMRTSKALIISLIILILGGAGVANSILSGKSARLDEVGIVTAYNQKKYQIVALVISNYLSHFNPNFLFFSGDINKRSQLPGFGQISLIHMPFLILGMVYIFRKKRIEYFLPLTLLLIAPIPASITRESPHALRSIAVVPFIALITSFGIYKLASFFKKSIYIYFLLIIIFLSYFFIYYKNFITYYSKQTSNDWQYSYKKAFENPSGFDQFDQVIISDRYSQPYIFALFYLKYDPVKYRSEVELNQTIRKETSVVKRIGKLHFTNIDFYQLPKGKNLIFAHPSERMDEIDYKKVINNPDGSLAWFVYEYEK